MIPLLPLPRYKEHIETFHSHCRDKSRANMGRLSATDLAIIIIPIVSLIFGIAQVSVQSTVQQSTNDTSLTAWPPAPIFGSDRLASVPDKLVRSVTDSLLAAGAIAIVLSAFAILQAIDTLYSVS